MHSNLLIDAIVRQTTVLLARLSTAAGIRAPLAGIADQVFVDLSAAIESQGVSRKVVADMFGLALRTYQKKVNRLAQARGEEGTTLWQGILDLLAQEGTATRRFIMDRFQHDEPQTVGAILNDLVTSGLAYRTGNAENALYGLTPEADLDKLISEENADAVASMVWLSIYRSDACTKEELHERLGIDIDELSRIIDLLVEQGRATLDVREGRVCVTAAQFVVPVGSSEGWEASVFDHYQAMANAIAQKLSLSARRSEFSDVVGGTTLSFDLDKDHPHREEVLSLLSETRTRTEELWKRVAKYNQENPPSEEAQKVTFYAGQAVQGLEE